MPITCRKLTSRNELPVNISTVAYRDIETDGITGRYAQTQEHNASGVA